MEAEDLDFMPCLHTFTDVDIAPFLVTEAILGNFLFITSLINKNACKSPSNYM